MARFLLPGLIVLELSVAFGQIGGPQYPPDGGGYPGGQYPGQTRGPGIPWPRRKKDKNASRQQDEQNLKSLSGMLRRLDEKELVLEAADKRILRVNCAATTKYLKAGGEIKASELQPGDHLLVDASQDDQGRFFAVRVTLEKAGTPGERRAAAAPVEDLPRMTDDDPPAQSSDDERPRMKRAGQSAPATEVKPQAKAAPEEEPVAVVRPIEVPADPDGEAKPHLKRGKPPERKSAPVMETAEARPATPPNRGAELPRPIESRSVEQTQEREPQIDPFIEKARGMAESFVETLPNYMVKQLTTRYVSLSKANWQPQDTISTDLIYEGGKEHYKNVLLNGKASKGKIEESGAWSTGEFGTVLRDLFSPSTAADFHPNGSPAIAGRSARAYSFRVEQENSHWQVIAPGQSYKPAYRGSVWIDKETARVLRIEMQARNMPKDFPLDTVESATDYEFVRIGAGTYLLPTHSETLSCIRGTSQCSRNVIEFRNYKRFGADSSITYTPDAK